MFRAEITLNLKRYFIASGSRLNLTILNLFREFLYSRDIYYKPISKPSTVIASNLVSKFTHVFVFCKYLWSMICTYNYHLLESRIKLNCIFASKIARICNLQKFNHFIVKAIKLLHRSQKLLNGCSKIQVSAYVVVVSVIQFKLYQDF